MTKQADRRSKADHRFSAGTVATTAPRYILHNGQWYVLKAHMAAQMQLAIEIADKGCAERVIEQLERAETSALLHPNQIVERPARPPEEAAESSRPCLP